MGNVPTYWQQAVVMEFGKRHDTTDFCPRQLVTDLLPGNCCIVAGYMPVCLCDNTRTMMTGFFSQRDFIQEYGNEAYVTI